ncbi:MAG: zinc ABC transporter substrate-binding protein [Bacilli bacterium]|nr:zinc ABC transporter substrate-binding protein [Bacilli bacterium]
MAIITAACNVVSVTDKLQILTSFFVMEDFARKVGGQYVEVESIVPSGSEIHGYEPTTGDIVKLTTADMFIYNGAGLEHFVTSLQEAVNNDNLQYVEASRGLTLLVADEHQDPHTWLSPLNAKKQMENIKDAIVAIDQEHASYYENRFSIFAAKFDELHDQYQTLLEPGEGQYLVTGHAAFGYLTNAYDLIPLPIGGHDSEQEPTQQDIAHVIDIVNQNNIRYVYAESLTPSDAVLTVIQETNAELETLSPIESLTAEQTMSNEDYFTVMKDNLFAIAKGFI